MRTEYAKIKDSIYRYQRSVDGLIAKIYTNQRQRCRERGRSLPAYNLIELREWCKRQPRFNTLYIRWVKNNYDPKLTPSIDRKNPLGLYMFDNIQIMTWLENHQKGVQERYLTQGKPVAQLDRRTQRVLKRYPSVSKAAEATSINFRMISAAATGFHKSAGGYQWAYLTDFYNKVKGGK